MPSEEMLKQLLDEFVEKEALINEELKVVSEQIDELQNRLGQCNERLVLVSKDREKVLSMKERYLDGLSDLPAPPDTKPAAAVAVASSEVKVHSVSEMKSSQSLPKPSVSSEPKPEAPVVETKSFVPAAEAKAPAPAAETKPAVIVEAARLPVPAAETKPVALPEVKPTPVCSEPEAPVVPAEPKASGLSSLLGLRNKAAASESQVEQGSIQKAIDSLDTLSAPPLPAATPAVSPEVPGQPDEQVPPPEEVAPVLAEEPPPPPAPAQEQPAAPAAADSGQPEGAVVDLGAAEGEVDEAESDTVKSINEALRSLFR